ncbi:MAG: TIGR02647 family protein [Pseudomonadota bacterium]
MPYTQNMLDEMNVLLRYKLTTTQEGIKVHHSADPAVISATRRLHEKGLITQEDGGYLTNLGLTTAEHVQAVHTVLKSG